ncbi:RPP21 [Ovibos moschatus]
MAGPVKDREALQRLSFLYQAAHCVLAQDPENQALARFYCHTERTIAKRLVLRRGGVRTTTCLRPQGPLGEANSLPWLLFPPHPGSDLHPAAETLQGSALDCTDLPDMPAQPAVPQRPEACTLGRPARGPAGEPGRSQTTTALAKHSPPHSSPAS